MTITDQSAQFNLHHGMPPRTPGVHVTGVLAEVARKIGVLRRGDEDEDLDLMLMRYERFQPGDIALFNRIAAGLAWEDWIARQVPGLLYHPGEIELDGIYGNPDGFMIEDGRIHEFKFTWKSANQDRRPIANEWLWINQLKCYCKMLRAIGAVLHVYYSNDEYKGDGPKYRVWCFDFAYEEIEAAWKMILANRYLVQIH